MFSSIQSTDRNQSCFVQSPTERQFGVILNSLDTKSSPDKMGTREWICCPQRHVQHGPNDVTKQKSAGVPLSFLSPCYWSREACPDPRSLRPDGVYALAHDGQPAPWFDSGWPPPPCSPDGKWWSTKGDTQREDKTKENTAITDTHCGAARNSVKATHAPYAAKPLSRSPALTTLETAPRQSHSDPPTSR